MLLGLEVGFYRAFGGTDKDYEIKLCKNTIDQCDKKFNMDGLTYMKEHSDEVERIQKELVAKMRERRNRSCKNCDHFGISGCLKYPKMQYPKKYPCKDWVRNG